MRASRVAWALCGLTAVAAAVQFALWVPNASAVAAKYDPFLTFPIITLATLAAAVVGAAIVSRHPRNPVGWLFCVANCLAEVGLAAEAYAQVSGIRSRPLPGASYAAWFEIMTASPFALSALVLLLLLFPTGRLASPRWRLVAWTAGANFVALEVVSALVAGPPSRAQPLDGVELHGPLRVAVLVTQLVLLGTLVLAAVSVLGRRRRATGDERQQLRLFWMATAAFVGSLVLLAAADPLQAVGLPEWVPGTVFYLTYGGLPIAAGLAILKYRLYDIDVILNRAVVFAGLAAVSTAGYVVVVVTAGAVLGRRAGSGPTVSLLATALVAVAVQPVRQRVRRLADRLVYGERAAPYDVLASFARQLGGTLSVDEVLPRMAAAAAQGVGARSASVRVLLADGEDRTVRWPEPAGAPRPDVTVPVLHAGAQVGEIALELSPGGRLDRPAAALVADLAAQAGIVLNNVRLTDELRRRLRELSSAHHDLATSGQRLLAAQTEERQRLERRITEEVQPHLSAISAGLEDVQRLLPDPARAAARVEAMAADATAGLEALREIARGVFPPLLADRGLAPALAAAARTAGVPVALTVEPPDRRYPPALESAAYFCCLLVLAEAARAGTAARVRLTAGPERLELDFAGVPLPPDLLAAIRDRVGATGGRVEPLPGVLRAEFPARVPAGGSALAPAGR